MKNNIQKFFLSFCIILLCLCTLPFGAAYADTTDSLFSKFMSNSLRALEIQMNALNMGIADGARDLNDFLAKPFKTVANDFVYVDYTTPIDTIDEYFNRSKLTIRPNAILIDDVPYTNIWLSKDAAEKFRINSFDIVTAWNIASESNGTFVTGVGHVCDIPIYQVGVYKTSPYYYIPETYPDPSATFKTGKIFTVIEKNAPDQWYITAQYPNGVNRGALYGGGVTELRAYISGASAYVKYTNKNALGQSFNSSAKPQYWDENSFEFDWIASEIPVDAELPNDYGLKVQVPTYYVNDWLIDYGDTYINQELNINTTNTDLMVAIDSLLEIVNNFTYTTNTDIIYKYDTDLEPTPPTPTPTPTPPPEPTPPMPTPTPATGTDIISETPWGFLEAWLQNIRDILRAIYDYVKQIVEYYLENIHADLFFIEQKLDEIIEKLDDVGEDIANKLSLIYADIGDITVDIGSFLDDFIIDLEQAPIKLADKTLDILKLVFLPVLTRLRNALGIWHYVTEWISSISSPFAYFINILSSAYPAAMTPIYACVAGTLCILVYKRFGR